MKKSTNIHSLFSIRTRDRASFENAQPLDYLLTLCACFVGVRSSSCGRLTVDQFVWISGLLLGPLSRFYLALLFSFDSYFILFPTVFSMTRKRVCSLQCLHSLVKPLTTNNHTLSSHLRLVFPFCRLLRLAGTTAEVF
jgi:hypothetical protein